MPRPFDVCEHLRKEIADLRKRLDDIRERGGPSEHEQPLFDALVHEVDNKQYLMDMEGCTREVPDIPPRPGLKNLSIAHDFEITQAIQYSDITHQTSNRGRNNEVPLIAKKNTILRVYVYARHIRGSTPTRVTGVLQYSRTDKDRYIRYLSPINEVRVDEDRTGVGIPLDDINFDNTDRGNSNHTLNFAIPADHCSGSMKFTVTIFDPDHKSEVYNNSEPMTRYHTFTDIGEMMIHAVLVKYEELGEDGNVVINTFDPPSEHDLMDLLYRFAKKIYPIAGFGFFQGGVETITIRRQGLLKISDLYQHVAEMGIASSGYREIYVGLASGSAQSVEDYISWLGGQRPPPPSEEIRVVVGFFRDTDTSEQTRNIDAIRIAEEIGSAVLERHTMREGNLSLSYFHVECENSTPVQGRSYVDYPKYEGYPKGSIGEYGFDYATSSVFSPKSTYDFMSDCYPQWVSPYTYEKMIDRFKRSLYVRPIQKDEEQPPFFGQPMPVSSKIVNDILFLDFQMNDEGRKIHLNYGYHIPIPNFTGNQNKSAEFSCKLLDEQQITLQSGACYLLDHQDDSQSLFGAIPWNPKAKSLELYRKGKCIYTYKLQDDKPNVGIPKLKLEKQDGKEVARVEWSSEESPADESLRYILRYSNDKGNNWRAIAVDLKETNYTINNTDLLPGGDNCCMFQVIAHSGLHTTVRESSHFTIIKKPRQAYILSPKQDTVFFEGEPITLTGGGFSPDFGSAHFEEIVWNSRIDGFLGIGHEVILHSLSVGLHRIIVTVPDGFGDESAAGIYVRVKHRESKDNG